MQVYSNEMVENLATAFPRRAENSFAWGNAISYYLGMPRLRGFWPMSATNGAGGGGPLDLSGNANTMTNTGTATFGVYGLQSYTSLNGINQYHTRADAAIVDVTGAMTLGAWVRLTGVTANAESIIDKNGAYALTKTNATQATFAIAGVLVNRAVTWDTNWHFLCARFIPNTEVSIWFDNARSAVIAGVPAATANTATPLNLGSTNPGVVAQYWPGDIALAFLCATNCSNAQVSALYSLTRPMFYGS